MDARALLDDGQHDLVCDECLPVVDCLLTRLRQQCHLPATLHRPLQTRPRLCNHHPRHQPHSHHFLHQGITYTTLLVGPPVLQCCSDDFPRRLGLSMERAEAHSLRRKIKTIRLDRRPVRCRRKCWLYKRRERRWKRRRWSIRDGQLV
jgi:hypothetical protein